MYKLLIVDDELLVQVGIQSMLDWSELGLTVCGTATNGQSALKIIDEHLPDIVVTDIKMPVMDGLELIRICRERYGDSRPYFIILTSYEDFHMAKEALTYQVSDYLIKLELTPENLRETIEKVLQKIHQTEIRKHNTDVTVYPFYDKFFISLLHDLFESEEQFILQSKDLNLKFDYAQYICCYGEIISEQADTLPVPKQLSLFTSALHTIKELVGKYMPCYALSLDIRHFALIFCYVEKQHDYSHSQILDIIDHINMMLQNYYNVTLYCGIGTLVGTPFAISDSYQYSRQSFRNCNRNCPIIAFQENISLNGSFHNSFNISLFKSDLCKAFEEYDAAILSKTITAICDLFSTHPQHYVQALDASCNILYLAISMLQDGETIVSDFFQDTPDGYRSIYRQPSVEHIVTWLHTFGEKLSQLFESKRKDYKNHIVMNVKKYIHDHITQRLSLNEVAAVFGISPNYLSQLFSKYNDTGFSEYINICKVNESKKLLEDGRYKVYETAQMMGFESAFYFSKVFKKVEGISPTEYIHGKYT